MKNISDHAHPMHKGPHHDKYMHPENRNARKGDHALGDENHLDSLKGMPEGADVAAHKGAMKKSY